MPKITQLYAWVVADKDENDEGVPAFMSKNGPMPLMGADMKRMDSMRQVVQMMADQRGKEVKLVRSTKLEVVEIVKPKER